MLTRRELMAAAGAGLAAAAERQPNFVFLFSDDHHFQCLGAAGNPHIHTPNLDRLAARGLRFSNSHLSTSQCTPSRAILLSGRESFQNGLLSNGVQRMNDGIGPTTIEQLRRAGYDTALVGKWHIKNQPADCGFTQAPLWLRAGGSKYRDPELCRGLDGQPKATPGHITDLFTDAAIDVIKGAGAKPFFLWLAYNAPHTPWYADDRYRARYEGKDPESIAPPVHPPGGKKFDWITYYAVITHLDEAVGRVIAELERRKLWDNTYIFFLGDNGYMAGTRGWSGKVVPWEESVRSPFIAAGAKVKRGATTDSPAASVDLAATWLDLAGVKPAGPLAGRSLRPLLETGKGGPDEGFVVWADSRPGALSAGGQVDAYRQVRTRTHKLTVWESGKQAAFDHVRDFAEQRDLTADPASAKVVAGLRESLRRRMRATGDPALGWLDRRP